MSSTSQVLITATPPKPSLSPALSDRWWNANLPSREQTPTCPSYLTYAITHPKERANLSTLDAHFKRQTWPEVRAHVAANRLDQFTRVPSELRRYRQYTEKLVREYGSVMRFVLDERLGWRDSRAGEGRFASQGKYLEKKVVILPGGSSSMIELLTIASRFLQEDYKILLNDWPYGIDKRIVHLVVWTKFATPSDPVTDDLLPESRAELDSFVRRTFSGVCGEENVIWFRNWGALKSVHAVEHFHVMLYDPPREFVGEVTGGDVSLAEKMERGLVAL